MAQKNPSFFAKLNVDRSSAGYLVVCVEFVNDKGHALQAYEAGGEYRRLELRAQADNDRDYEKMGYYGVEIKWYVPGSAIDVEQAGQAYKMLAKVNNLLVRHAEKWGETYDYAEIALRVCNLIGAGYLRNGYSVPVGEIREDLTEMLRKFKGA